MKMLDFMLLEQHQKTELLHKSGVFSGKIKTGRKTKVLYQIDAFYVEITYKRYRLFIDTIRCFSATNELDPYIQQINIEELINQ